MIVRYEKDRATKYVRLNKTEEFYGDLGDLLIGALLKELSEPLDLLDLEEADKARVRQTY